MAQDDLARNKEIDRRVVLLLATVITSAWAISFIVDIVDDNYEPPVSVHALMMIVAGAVFGEGLLHSVKRKNGAEDGE